MSSSVGSTSIERAISPGERARAVALGLACHGSFAAAIATMIIALHEGLRIGQGRLVGGAAWAANAALAVSFPLVHSFLLTRVGARTLDVVAGDPSGRLRSTSYALLASLQLLAIFALWSPTGPELWRAQGAVRWITELLFAASFALLGRAMMDAGLALQSGWLGWSAVARGRAPRFAPFPSQGLFRFTRQPVYVAFTLTLWTAPVLTTDRLVLAIVWTLYCLVGPLHKERRLLAREPERYLRFQSTVPYWLPRLPRTDGE